MDVTEFKKLPILGILRGIEERDVESLIEAIVSSGLKTIELAMNTPNASVVLSKMVETAKGKLSAAGRYVFSTRTCLRF